MIATVWEMPPFKCATVCASNMNRSMEGHKQLFHSGFKVSSYGVGRMVLLFNARCACNVGLLICDCCRCLSLVRIKGCLMFLSLAPRTKTFCRNWKRGVWTSTLPLQNLDIVVMHDDLFSRNEHTWGKDLRKMLERNTLIKRAPQRWQDNTEQ